MEESKIISSLIAHIKEKNTYLDTVLEECFVDPITGIVMDHSKEFAAFPNDTLGNYAYIRKFSSGGNFIYDTISDLASGYNVVKSSTSYVFVMSVENGDINAIMHNMRASLSGFSVDGWAYVQMLSYLSNNAAVVSQEMKLMREKNDIEQALQNLSQNSTLASIRFTLTTISTSADCNIINPCICN